MSMQVFEKIRVPFWALSAVVCLSFLAAWPVLGKPSLGRVALLPGALAIADLITRRRKFAAEFSEDHFVLTGDEQEYPYDSIERLELRRIAEQPEAQRPKRFDIKIIHLLGTIVVPKSINIPSKQLYEFLLQRVHWQENARPIDKLSEYYAEQCLAFGADRVHAFGRRENWEFAHWARRTFGRCLALVAAATAWILLEAYGQQGAKVSAEWISSGILLYFIAAMWCGFSWSYANPRRCIPSSVRNKTEPGIVISPGGLALIQGELKGEMLWEEIRKMTFKQGKFQKPIFTIDLGIEGGNIVIYDVFDRPLWKIHELLKNYWGDGE